MEKITDSDRQRLFMTSQIFIGLSLLSTDNRVWILLLFAVTFLLFGTFMKGKL